MASYGDGSTSSDGNTNSDAGAAAVAAAAAEAEVAATAAVVMVLLLHSRMYSISPINECASRQSRFRGFKFVTTRESNPVTWPTFTGLTIR